MTSISVSPALRKMTAATAPALAARATLSASVLVPSAMSATRPLSVAGRLVLPRPTYCNVAAVVPASGNTPIPGITRMLRKLEGSKGVPSMTRRHVSSGMGADGRAVTTTRSTLGLGSQRRANSTARPQSGTPNPRLWLTRNPAPFVTMSGSARSQCREDNARTCCTSRRASCGRADKTNATTPETRGVEADVPLKPLSPLP